MSLLVGLVIAMLPAAVRAADNPSNIPGVPLPSPVVSGLLGGPIYDVVYRIDVPAGYVLLAGITGTAGTDFDLYLFSQAATTVVSNQGLLAESTGPTSTEQISWATSGAQTVYVDLNGATNVEGTYTLSVQLVPDATPPTVSLAVLGSASYVNSPTITVIISGWDDLSGVTDMSFSSDDSSWSPWEPYAPSKIWSFEGADGIKLLWVRVRNGVGLVSAPSSVSVTLDTVPPIVIGHYPAPDAVLTTMTPTLSVGFDEAIDPRSWSSNGLVLQSATGAVLPGHYRYDSTTRTGFFTPSSSLAPGNIYSATVGNVTDLAGNRVVPSGSWLMRVLLPATIALAPRLPVVRYGDPETLTLTSSLPANSLMTVERSDSPAGPFLPVLTVSSAGGSRSIGVDPPRNGYYRATYSGDATHIAATSSAVRVIVRRGVSVTGSGPAVIRFAAVGHRTPVTAQLAPADVSVCVFRAYRYSAGHGWVLVNSFFRTADAAGRASVLWAPSLGLWKWVVATPPSASFANQVSAGYRYRVSR